MDTAHVGGWLVGVGALLVVLSFVVGSPRPVEGMTFRGPLTLRRDRLAFAVQATGLALAAVGSVVLVAGDFPSLWLVLVTLGAIAVGIYALSVWKLHQYWQPRLAEALQALRAEDADKYPVMAWQAACAKRCASWRWCLMHPLHSDDYWPRDCYNLPNAPLRE
jgi:hypothetical protein